MIGHGKKQSGEPTDTDGYALVLAQERLVLEAQVAIGRLLREADLKRSDLAALLGVSEARVSQMLSENATNLTLRTLARIFHVLGSRCRVLPEAEIEATRARADEPEGVMRRSAGIDRASADAATAPEADSSPIMPRSSKAADAWLVDGPDVSGMLSEDAPFASRMVWVSDHRMVAANENQPLEPTSVRASTDARRWAAAPDQYAFG